MPDPVRPNGMTSAAAALQMLERRQAVLANNLANASTRGFKAETPFTRLLDNAVAATDTRLDLTPGTLTESGNPLDVAVEFDGFFVTATPAGERFIRGGAFRLDAERRLVDAHGDPVLGEEGALVLPPGAVTIDATGLVQVNGKPVQRLRVETVADRATLVHEGGTRFIPDASRTPVPVEARSVRQGFVEESNVNTLAVMTDMMTVLRRFEAAQKMVTSLDAVRGIAVNQLADPV